ncbi:MAG TPA: hypothetical protein VJR29_02785 [bacterium]|nr:hypothetical protein [bacterium]
MSELFSISNLNRDSTWEPSLPSFSLPQLPRLFSYSDSEAKPSLPWPIPSRRFSFSRFFGPTEGYLHGPRPLKASFPDTPALPPFIIYLGISTAVHGVALGAAALSEEEKVSLKDQAKRRKERLIEVATDALKQKKEDLEFQPDPSTFLIEIETIGANSLSDDETGKRVQNLQSEFEDFPRSISLYSELKDTFSLATQLYYRHFMNYGRSFSRISDFLEFKKGNCSAQTKMFLAAFFHSGIALPESYGIGVQVFKRHVQPVLFHKRPDGKIDWVQNLISGRKSKEVVAPIYDPAIVYAGFLIKQGQDSPMSFKDLLISPRVSSNPMPDERAEQGFFVKEDSIDLPSSDIPFNGDVPEDAILEVPQFEAMEEEVLSPPDFEGREETVSPSTNPVKGSEFTQDSLGPIEEKEGKRREYRLFSDAPDLFSDRWIDFGVAWYQGGDSILYFRTSEQRDRFLNLQTDSERMMFLTSLARGSLARREASGRFRKIETIMADPYKIFPTLQDADLDQVILFLKEWDQMRVFLEDLSRLLPGNVSLTDDDPIRELAVTQIIEPFSRTRAVAEKNRLFLRSIEENPKDIILMINQVGSVSARIKNLSIVRGLEKFPKLKESQRHFTPLGVFLSDPKKVTYLEAKGEQTAWSPPSLEENFIEVELLNTNDSSAFPQAPVPKKGSVDLAQNKPEAGIVISPQTMVDLILYAPVGPHPRARRSVYDRWDPILSRELERSERLKSDPFLADLVAHWYIKGLEKAYPQFTQTWMVFPAPIPFGNPPKDYSRVKSLVTQTRESGRWKNYVPPHLLSRLNKIEKAQSREIFSVPPP